MERERVGKREHTALQQQRQIHIGPELINREGVRLVPVTGVSPPFCDLLSTLGGWYCTLEGWFLIFFSRIFALAADIFYTKTKRHASVTPSDRLVAKRKAERPQTPT